MTLHEKLWIIRKKADHENMKHTQLAVAFEAHFKRPISRQCITRVGVGEIVRVNEILNGEVPDRLPKMTKIF